MAPPAGATCPLAGGGEEDAPDAQGVSELLLELPRLCSNQNTAATVELRLRGRASPGHGPSCGSRFMLI